MTNFSFEVSGENYEVKSVEAEKSQDWVISKAESYVPDRDSEVLTEFKKKFPNLKVTSAKEVYELASRNKGIQEWLANFNLRFNLEIKVPFAFKNKIEAKEFSKLAENIKKINDARVDETTQTNKASDEFKLKLNQIRKKSKDTIDALKAKDQRLKILMLNSNDLPASISLAIAKYTPSQEDKDAPTQKAFAREILVNYQLALLDVLTANQETEGFDIQDVINENSLK